MKKLLIAICIGIVPMVGYAADSELTKAPLYWGESSSVPANSGSATNLTLHYAGNTNIGSGIPAAEVSSDGTIDQSSTTNLGAGPKMLRNNKQTNGSSTLYLQATGSNYLSSVTLVLITSTSAGSDQSATKYVKFYTEDGILAANQISSISGLYYGSSGIQSNGTATTTSNWDTHNAAGFDVKTNHTSKTAPKVTSITINLKDTSTISKIAIASVSNKKYAYLTGYRVALKSACTAAPTISAAPSSATYDQNDDAVALSFTGTGHTAQKWQYSSDNSVWNDFSPAQTGTTYTPSTSTTGTTYYRVVTTCDSYSTYTTNSTAATITVNAGGGCVAPTFGTNITTGTDTYCQNASATALTVASEGATYQWQKSTTSASTGFSDIDDATSGSYTPLTTSTGTAYYRCVATKSGCSANSNVRTVTVNANPTISSNVTTGTDNYCNGDGATALSVTSASATFQWQKSTTSSSSGFSNISGETNASYTPLTTTNGTAYYKCVATKSGCSTDSNVRTVVVKASPGLSISLKP